jgi:ATP-dependent RNA helicase DeaD
MSHVCRRGALSREQIGAIDVGVNATVIEISQDVADELERRCKRPDPRDPHVRISREGALPRPPVPGPRRYDAAPPEGSVKQRPAFKRDGPRVQRAARARHTTPRTPEL